MRRGPFARDFFLKNRFFPKLKNLKKFCVNFLKKFLLCPQNKLNFFLKSNQTKSIFDFFFIRYPSTKF